MITSLNEYRAVTRLLMCSYARLFNVLGYADGNEDMELVPNAINESGNAGCRNECIANSAELRRRHIGLVL